MAGKWGGTLNESIYFLLKMEIFQCYVRNYQRVDLSVFHRDFFLTTT